MPSRRAWSTYLSSDSAVCLRRSSTASAPFEIARVDDADRQEDHALEVARPEADGIQETCGRPARCSRRPESRRTGLFGSGSPAVGAPVGVTTSSRRAQPRQPLHDAVVVVANGEAQRHAQAGDGQRPPAAFLEFFR